MAVFASAQSLIRSVLIAIGLWHSVRLPLRRTRDAVLLQLARAGIHNPTPFLPVSRELLGLLRDTEKRAQSAKTPSELFRNLDPLVLNASATAELGLARMRQFRLPRDVCQHVDRLDRRLAAIRSLPDLASIMADQPRLGTFYKNDGFQLFPAPSSRRLVVAFTTVFNNFGVSNAVLYALLRRFDVSILILKDPTVYTYGCGVRGLGDDPEQLADAVSRLARDIGCTEIYVTGFSSGGYPSLLFSSLIECRGYLGFSIHTGSGFHGDPLPRRRVFNDAQNYLIRRNVAPRFQINLRDLFEGRRSECNRVIVAGDRDDVDMAHARDVAHCPGFDLSVLENCGHDTISSVIERGLMDGLLARLLRC
jgi:hypothetical protein